MNKKGSSKNEPCCGSASVAATTDCCRIEALVPIDSRGQIVLPKDVRERAELEAGDKLAVVAFESDGKVCCITLIKADALADTVRGTLGPMMSNVLQG